ncbi:hypothetical protein [Roseovarius atlanticus]|uniref:hypothetical protein n=1 Tax=Roseovarius atlanticus TaxID=1641875 RepID=UPI00070F3002|nr:hypothetical protein [Roseovarius atlanticus]
MSDRIEIRESESGVVRVFDVDLTRAEAEAFNRRNGSWPLKDALGAESLDPHYVDMMQIEDLEGYGLSQYLEQGMGVSSHDLEDAHVQIEGLKGTVLVVGSGAFGGEAQVLTPRAPLRLVATFNEDKAPVQFDPLPSAGAQVAPATEDDDTPEPKKKSDAAMSGRVAMIALLVLFVLTAIVVWVAA